MTSAPESWRNDISECPWGWGAGRDRVKHWPSLLAFWAFPAASGPGRDLRPWGHPARPPKLQNGTLRTELKRHCPQRPSSVRRPGQGRRKRTCGLSADAAENKSPPHPSDQSLVWGGGNGPQPWWARQASRRGWGRLLEANRPSRKAGRRVPWVNWTLFLPRSSTLQNCPASPCSGASCGSQTLPPPRRHLRADNKDSGKAAGLSAQ